MTAQAATRDLVIGIDAGGTRTRAALAVLGGEGPALSTGTAGPGNALAVPVDLLAEHLGRAVGDAVPEPLRPRVRAVVAGLAGCSALPDNAGAAAARGALQQALERLGVEPEFVGIEGDTDIAFAAAPGTPRDGLLLIAGTGAVAARIARGRTVAVADGDGWLLGDEGSGFWIGRRAVRAVLAALDGRGAPTALTAAVLARYLGAPDAGGASTGNGAHPAGGAGRDAAGHRGARERLVQAVHERPVLDLAALSPLVAGVAARGDAVASGLLDGAARRLAATLGALAPRPGETLVTAGGLLGPEGVLLGRLERRLAGTGLRPLPVPDGLAGAVALARRALSGRE